MKEDVNVIKKLLYEYKNKFKICLLLAVLICTGEIQDMLCYIALKYRKIS